jgi:RHS repeat-associated protein
VNSSSPEPYDTPNRELHPIQGRWLSPDPAGLVAVDPSNPQTWNRYVYVLNNPLGYIDPDGLDCVYLNGAGNGVQSIDHQSNFEECTGNGNGGYWVDGTVTNINLYTNSDDVSLQGVLPDNQGYLTVSTDAYYTQVSQSDQRTYAAMGIDIPTGMVDIIRQFRIAQIRPFLAGIQ